METYWKRFAITQKEIKLLNCNQKNILDNTQALLVSHSKGQSISQVALFIYPI